MLSNIANMPAQNEAPTQPEPKDELALEPQGKPVDLPTAKKQLWQRISATIIGKIEDEARKLDPESTVALLTDLQILRSELSKISSFEDIGPIFTGFFEKLEGRPETDNFQTLLYKTRILLDANRKLIDEILSDESEGSFLNEYANFIGSRQLSKDKKGVPGKLKRFAQAYARMGSKIKEKADIRKRNKENSTTPETLARVAQNAKFGAGGLAAAQGIKYLGIIPGVAPTAQLITGMSFAAYTIYLALLLSEAAGKATRGTTNLEVFSAALVDLADMGPEAVTQLLEIIDALEEAIDESGDFEVQHLLSLYGSIMQQKNGAEHQVQATRMADAAQELNGIKEACRLGISGRTKQFVNGGAKGVTFVSAAAFEHPALGAATAAAMSGILATTQEVLFDIDKPYGEEGSMTLSREPLEAARTQISFISREFDEQARLHEQLQTIEKVDQNIINSFYGCFRDIFDPYFQNYMKAQKLAARTYGDKAFAAIAEEGHLTAAKDNELDAEVNGIVAAKVARVPAPDFLLGDEVKEVKNPGHGLGVVDMSKQVCFRDTDKLDRQMALLEGVLKKINADKTIGIPKGSDAKHVDHHSLEAAQGLARDLLKVWIKRINAQKQMVKEGLREEPKKKNIPKQIEAAIGTMMIEIKGNINDIGESRYVRKRLEGSQRVDTETANRATDWEGTSRETLLTPIHDALIAQLIAEARKDTEKATKYLKVIDDINEVRAKGGLDPKRIDEIAILRTELVPSA